MNKYLFLLLPIIVVTKIEAHEEIEELYLLSEDVRTIILKSKDGNPMPEGNFSLTTKQADQMKALSLLDDTMLSHLDYISTKKDCDKENASLAEKELVKRVGNRGFSLEAVVISSDKKFEQKALNSFNYDEYSTYLDSLFYSGNSKALDISTLDKLEQKYRKLNPGVNWDNLSLTEQEKLLSDYSNTYLGIELPAGILMKEMTFQRLINKSSEWKTTLSQAKHKLSTEQKISLVSKLGGYMGNLYNFDRNLAGDKARGEYVDSIELLDSIKKGTPGGICRDIALAQTQFLRELGFQKSYVLSYKDLSGRHSTVISEDPQTGKIVKFNYAEKSEMNKGSGTEALTQDSTIPDHTLYYRLYDSDGIPLTRVPSEIALMLKDTAGGDVERIFNQQNFKLNKVGFSTSFAEGNLFTGTTSIGENLYGIALSKKVTPNDYVQLGVGGSLSKLNGQRSLYQISQEEFYMRANLELSTPKLKLGNTQANLYAGANGDVLLYNSTETRTSSSSGKSIKDELDGHSDYYLGVRSTTRFNNGKTVYDAKAYAAFYPDWDHVAIGNKYIAVNDSIVVRSGVSHDFSDSSRALIDSAIVLKNYGTSIVAKATYQDSKHGFIAGVGGATPLSKNIPTFLPGGERRAFTSVGYLGDSLIFEIEYDKNFTNGSRVISVNGKVSY